MKNIVMLVILFCSLPFEAQGQDIYSKTYEYIESMLAGEKTLNFADAVFAVENAYYDDKLDMGGLRQELILMTQLAKAMSGTRLITYEKSDHEVVTKHAALFKVMTDSIPVAMDSLHVLLHFPCTYDFNDPLGQEDWDNMFVSKLLGTGKGNCHSLPYLYKIIADELTIPCYLAFAPNHIYIKLYSESTGWYNTELTSATFPIDAWIIASGYVTVDAIRNGLYMDTISDQKAVANCLVDLAQGYQRKYGKANPDFVVKCCNTVLQYHPANIHALLTRSEAQKTYIHALMKAKGLKNPERLFDDPHIKEMYSEMENTYVRLYESGYRRMPEEMYLKWMDLLKKEPGIYTEQRLITPDR